MNIDLLLSNCSQIATCAGDNDPRRGQEMRDVGIIADGAVAVDGGRILAVGPTVELAEQYTARQKIDCSGRAVLPGFVDCHTHTVFGGDRVHEFELRIGGATYLEIMAAGGGIRSTMQQTRTASAELLFQSARRRLDQMLALGSTTVEIKSGYGLDIATELKMLAVIERLEREHPCTIVPTFLGAHTVPPEYEAAPDQYMRLVIDEMLPAVVDWYAQSAFYEREIPLFCDVFCEDHAFDVEQSRQILTAAQELGMTPKIHVDQFNEMGGIEMAVGLGAISADHLDVTGVESVQLLAASSTIGVPLPAANFNLGHTEFAAARVMIDSGVALALATDLNPGSAPCYSMPLVMAIANRYQRLLPSETLIAGTINAACAVGLSAQIGSIAAGKNADLLVLNQADYRHISYFLGGNPVDLVIKNGVPLA
ncbi:MAG: imidazolonepropionase [Candidatus Promineifilaceae bacterium]|nr:imidazolonepropionase [Candidatus Promineifilaceae bacterium]